MDGNGYQRINRLRLLAMAPVLLAGVYTTGRNYLDALRLNGGEAVTDWRGEMVSRWIGGRYEFGTPDAIVTGLIHLAPVLVLGLITVGVWERVFSVVRGRPFNPGCIAIAVLFALLSHPAIPLLHLVFGLSFAMVFAYGAFGGEGRTFLAPALVAAVVVQVSFPGALNDHPVWTLLNGHDGTNLLAAWHARGAAAFEWSGIGWGDAFLGGVQGSPGATAIPAILLGAAVLVYARLASLRLIAGIVAGVLIGTLICRLIAAGNPVPGILTLPWHWHLVSGSLAFAALFIATDPAASSATDPGRWIQGLLIGLLVVLVRVANPAHPDGVYPVLLLVSMLAPVIDHGVAWFNIRRRMQSR